MSDNGYAKTGDLFRAKQARRKKDVVIQGQKFCLRSWSYLDLQRFNAQEDGQNDNLYLIIGSCIDPQTEEPIFSEDDIGRLNELDAGFVTELLTACLAHAGLGGEEPEKN